MTPRPSALILLLTASLLPATAEAAKQPAQKVDRAVKAAAVSGIVRQRVIVTANPGCRDTVRQTLLKHNASIKTEYGIIEGFATEISSGDLPDYAGNSCVAAIASDAPVRSTGTTTSSGLTSALRDTLGLPHYASPDPSVPTGATGVTVAIVDSGITPSANFGGRINGFFDFTKGGISAAPYDDYGHGTHRSEE